MTLGEIRALGEDADAPAGRYDARDERHLQQRRRKDRHRDRGLQLALEDREEAAGRGDGAHAEPFEVPRGIDERREERRIRVGAHDARGIRALDDAIVHRERPRLGVADVTGKAREPRVQHENAELEPIQRAPALKPRQR